MVDLQAYLQALITALRRAYGERLVYVGLQGSYLRGEAGEDSDVDVMTVIEALSHPTCAAIARCWRRWGFVTKPAASSAAETNCGTGTGWSCAICCTRRATASACCPSFFRPSRRRIRGNSYG